jgi:transcriptional regulator with XRE-family HTH domain
MEGGKRMETLTEASVNATDPNPGYGRRIRSARLAVNKTQRELAEAVEVTYATVCRWEGEQRFPNDEHLIRVAKACRASAAYLMFGDLLP